MSDDRCPVCLVPLRDDDTCDCTCNDCVAASGPKSTDTDLINSPPHYKAGGLEAIDVIEGFELGFHLGAVLKYVLRAGKKGPALEDLKKARWFLDRKISKLEKP